ncbi:ABC transporter permease [Acidaminobacter sp. JC074]|uniref:ABC transporter permease n=1 Tax=Acidaminobacter sp. JC074 TaxID=2530199 RepID=UPI001F0F1098|nr:ABC transporter permease [Acidaminobacter sp. JC074]MCH4889701.1 ABC transporter permease [Acidaminobacter sp. JC074]
MFSYMLKRMGLMLITFVITVFLFFFFIKLMPDNYVPTIGQGNDWYEQMAEKEGWNEPIVVQFGLWVKNIFTEGNFGYSHLLNRDVSEAYFKKIPASVKINIVPYLLSVPIAIIIGVVAALKKNKWQDTAISIWIMIFISVPYFVVGVVAQYFFYWRWGIAPDYKIATASEFAELGFWYGISTYIMPVIIITLASIPSMARRVRAELTEQLTTDYMLLARAKGLTREQAVFKHALRNALVPILPGIFIGLIAVLNGGIITEKIFRVDGTGRMYLAAFNGRDYALLMLINTFGQFLTLVSAIIADLSYTLFDPRVRFGSGKLS